MSTSRRRHLIALWIAVVGLLAAGGCAKTIPPTDPQSTATTLSRSPIESGQTTRPTPFTLSQEAVADAIRFRTSFGLRADKAWVREVANDTGSWRGFSRYGVPLTREEFAELESREARLAGAAPVIDAYARTVPAEWGGLYLDHEAGGVVVAQFTDHLSLHAARLRELVPGDNRIEVRQVRWSLEALNEHQQRIEAEIGWVASLDAEVTGIGIPVQRNVVELDISSALPDVEAEILEHFGQPEWLLVESDGVGRWDGPRGSLVVRAVGRGGAPIAGLWCVLLADDPAAAVDSTSNTDELGECRFEELGATSFTVEAKARSADDMAWVVLGRSRARVQAEGNSVVTLVVDTPPTTPDEPPATEGPPEGDGRAR